MIRAILFLQTIFLLTAPLNPFGFNTSHTTFGRHSLPRKETTGKFNQESLLKKPGYQIKTVVIDAGHGGHDPGCHGSSALEKHIALAIAKKVGAILQAQHPAIRVILTRDRDVFIPLHERAGIANRNNADLFLSIHCNFMPGSSATQGTETYVMGLHTAEYNLQVAKRENAAILLEENYQQNYDYDPNSPEGHIMLSMFQNAYLEQSILFAEKVEEQLNKHAGRNSRGVKQAGFVVLKATAMPSVLIETGFLSNSREEQYLNTDNGQQVVAQAIANAFGGYKGAVESRELASSSPVTPASPPVKTEPVVQNNTQNNGGQPGPNNTSISQVSQATPKREDPYGATVPAATSSSNTSKRSEGPIPLPPSVQRSLPPEAPKPKEAEAAGANFQFFVQLAASSQVQNTRQAPWNGLPYPIDMVREDNLYKYRVRNLASLPEAIDAKARLQSLGFPDAFVVVYQNGKRIPLAEAKRILGIP